MGVGGGLVAELVRVDDRVPELVRVEDRVPLGVAVPECVDPLCVAVRLAVAVRAPVLDAVPGGVTERAAVTDLAPVFVCVGAAAGGWGWGGCEVGVQAWRCAPPDRGGHALLDRVMELVLLGERVVLLLAVLLFVPDALAVLLFVPEGLADALRVLLAEPVADFDGAGVALPDRDGVAEHDGPTQPAVGAPATPRNTVPSAAVASVRAESVAGAYE